MLFLACSRTVAVVPRGGKQLCCIERNKKKSPSTKVHPVALSFSLSVAQGLTLWKFFFSKFSKFPVPFSEFSFFGKLLPWEEKRNRRTWTDSFTRKWFTRSIDLLLFVANSWSKHEPNIKPFWSNFKHLQFCRLPRLNDNPHASSQTDHQEGTSRTNLHHTPNWVFPKKFNVSVCLRLCVTSGRGWKSERREKKTYQRAWSCEREKNSPKHIYIEAWTEKGEREKKKICNVMNPNGHCRTGKVVMVEVTMVIDPGELETFFQIW